MAKATKPTVAETMPNLAAWMKAAYEHGTVYYAVEKVSKSGMMRSITLWTIGSGRDGKPDLMLAWPDHDAPAASHRHISFSFKHRCFRVQGCGMDMVFHTLYSLGATFGYKDFANKVQHCDLHRAE